MAALMPDEARVRDVAAGAGLHAGSNIMIGLYIIWVIRRGVSYFDGGT